LPPVLLSAATAALLDEPATGPRVEKVTSLALKGIQGPVDLYGLAR
jgi:class 3 adenylate cyclase